MTYEAPLKGSCLNMCPIKEIKWREKNKLLHFLEMKHGTEDDPKADPERVIKQFSRSAAGKVKPTSDDLRPSDVLLKTMNYLINNIVSLDTVSWIEIYNFVNDRIQAIRQDITIQMIEDSNSVQIYEKCVRFYVISSYILCEETQAKFDQFLNKQQLSICLEKVIYLYQKFQSESINEMVSINFSMNVDNCEKIYKHEILFKQFLRNDLIKLTLKTCISLMESNFIRFFACMKKLPVLLQIVFFHQFGYIRERALKILSVAYSSPSCQFPVEVLSQWMCLTFHETLSLCKAYKIKVKDQTISFNRKEFSSNAVLSVGKDSFVKLFLKEMNISTLIRGSSIEIK